MYHSSPYTKSLLTKRIRLHITDMSNNQEGDLQETLSKKLQQQIANKCTEDGYICPSFITIVQYSSGMVQEEYIVFHVVFSCFVANPKEGDIFEASVKSLTLAGVHAEVKDAYGNCPITVFIAHDTHHPIHGFHTLREGQRILVKIIGTRFELNDPCVYTIADLHQIGEDMNANVNETQKQQQQNTNEDNTTNSINTMSMILGEQEGEEEERESEPA